MATLFDSLDIEGTASTANKDPHTNVNAQQTRLAVYLCPSYTGQPFASPKASPPTGALTNYTAMGATTLTSLALAADPSAPPRRRRDRSCPIGV